MKKLLPLITLSLLWLNSTSQNLVPNPSFELFNVCPTATSQINRATGWTININTADYYNSCADYYSMVSVPNNGVGYQCPANGDAYCGFHAFRGVSPQLWQYREYFGRALANPLIIGQKYYISFKISLANESLCAVNKIGIKFTNINYGDTTLGPICPLTDNSAHFYSDTIISDTSGWTTIKGSFIADSSYQYFLIGNFFDNNHTDTSIIYGNFCYNSYYYIDDICISIDSLTCIIQNSINICDTNVNIIKNNKNEKKLCVYPNPSTSKTTIEIYGKNVIINIYTTQGVLIRQYGNLTNEKLYIENLREGVYFIKASFSNKSLIKKLIIIN